MCFGRRVDQKEESLCLVRAHKCVRVFIYAVFSVLWMHSLLECSLSISVNRRHVAATSADVDLLVRVLVTRHVVCARDIMSRRKAGCWLGNVALAFDVAAGGRVELVDMGVWLVVVLAVFLITIAAA